MILTGCSLADSSRKSQSLRFFKIKIIIKCLLVRVLWVFTSQLTDLEKCNYYLTLPHRNQSRKFVISETMIFHQ